MANGVDLHDITLDHQVHSAIDENAPPFLPSLASSKECGIFLMIDKIIRKPAVSTNTARLALLLLRSINHLSIHVTPSTNDNPLSFVVNILRTAEMVAADPDAYSPHLVASAKRLSDGLASLQKEEEPLSFFRASWKGFAVDLYREKLYHHIEKSED